jgi:hypothetical protein
MRHRRQQPWEDTRKSAPNWISISTVTSNERCPSIMSHTLIRQHGTASHHVSKKADKTAPSASTTRGTTYPEIKRVSFILIFSLKGTLLACSLNVSSYTCTLPPAPCKHGLGEFRLPTVWILDREYDRPTLQDQRVGPWNCVKWLKGVLPNQNINTYMAVAEMYGSWVIQILWQNNMTHPVP